MHQSGFLFRNICLLLLFSVLVNAFSDKHNVVMQSYRLAILNLQGSSASNRQDALRDFLHVNNIHIALFSEMKTVDDDRFHNYHLHLSPSLTGVGTGIATRVDCPFKPQAFIETERITSGNFLNTQITSVYAPSGSSKIFPKVFFL